MLMIVHAFLQRRYFVLLRGEVAYYDSEALSKHLGSVVLTSETKFSIEPCTDCHYMTIINPMDSLKLTFPTDLKLKEWLSEMRKAVC